MLQSTQSLVSFYNDVVDPLHFTAPVSESKSSRPLFVSMISNLFAGDMYSQGKSVSSDKSLIISLVD